jgi:hypothetical protein
MSSKGATKKEDPKAVKKEVKKEEVVKKTETKPASGETGKVMDNLTSKQAFKKFSYRGEDINKLLSLNIDELAYL